jgi:protoporphyrin/coproporphyrin ferrochelatase
VDLVFNSRSGPEQVPWLVPDVNDHLEALAEAGVPSVVVVPVGFISDHMEVIYDLDVEAVETAEKLGLPMVRAGSVGVDPRFVAMIRELLLDERRTRRLGRSARAGPATTPVPSIAASPPASRRGGSSQRRRPRSGRSRPTRSGVAAAEAAKRP